MVAVVIRTAVAKYYTKKDMHIEYAKIKIQSLPSFTVMNKANDDVQHIT